VTGATGGTWRQVKGSDTEIMAEMGGERYRVQLDLKRDRMLMFVYPWVR
jgi:hypothetical protein